MESLTIYGSVDQDSAKAIKRLRERNVGIVIRDESELNAIRIKAEKNKYVKIHPDKGKGKGKENEDWENVCHYFLLQRQRKYGSVLIKWGYPNKIVVHCPKLSWKYIEVNTWTFRKVIMKMYP